MPKKSKIKLNQSQDMEAIDAELAAAMEALDEKNVQVEGLLADYEPPPETESTEDNPETGDNAAGPEHRAGEEPKNN